MKKHLFSLIAFAVPALGFGADALGDGACCNYVTNLCTQTTEAACKALGKDYAFRGEGTPCGLDGTCIPTVSEWGVVAMALLVLTAGTIVVMRRRAVSA